MASDEEGHGKLLEFIGYDTLCKVWLVLEFCSPMDGWMQMDHANVCSKFQIRERWPRCVGDRIQRLPPWKLLKQGSRHPGSDLIYTQLLSQLALKGLERFNPSKFL
jgi:hypothetical protein